jgi:hypothetical protein
MYSHKTKTKERTNIERRKKEKEERKKIRPKLVAAGGESRNYGGGSRRGWICTLLTK